MKKLNIGIVACESMHEAIKECLASLEGSFRIYPIVPSCTFTVSIDLFKHHLDRSLIENDVTLLAYGICHPQILALLAEYGDQVVKMNGNNCYEMFLGTEKYAGYHGKSYWMLNEPFFTKWKKDILVGWGAGTVNGKMLIEEAFRKLVYLRSEHDQLDMNLVEDFAAAVGLEYEVHPIDTGNLKRLLEEALASASPIRRAKLPASSLRHPSQPDVRTILENIGEIIYRIDVHTKEFTFISPQVETILGYTPVEFIDIINNHVIVPLYHEDDKEKITVGRYNFLIKCVSEGMREPFQMEYRVIHKNGHLLWVSESVYPTFSSQGVIESFVGKIVDITERRQAQEALREVHDELEVRVKERTAELEALTKELRNEIHERHQMEGNLNRLNRAYRMVCECGRIIDRITDEKSLLDNICRIIVENGGYRLAWVGFADFDKQKTVRPVASAGYEEGYLESTLITWADEPKGRGPTGTAIRTGKPAIVKNIPTDPKFAPWRDEAIRRGYASSIALPLRMEYKNIGALNIYAADPDAFDQEEVDLLIQLAANLEYGLLSLRTRAARNRAEEALRESEELYRTLVETAPVGVSMTDLEGRIAYVSQRTMELHGYQQAQELLGRNALDLIAPEDRRKATENLQKTLQEGSLREQEVVFLRKDGTRFIGGVNTALLHDSDGRPKAIIATTRDITLRKQAEQDLRKSEERYRLMFENTGTYNTVICEDGNFLMMNELSARHLGGKPEDFIGKSICDYFPNDDCAEYLQRFRDVLDSGEGKIYEDCVKLPIGDHWFLTNIQPIRGPANDPSCVQLVCQDITKLKQAESELRELSEQLRNLTVHLQSIRESERTTIAREIHDELGQALTVLKFSLLDLKNSLPANQPPLLEKAQSISGTIDATAQIVNRIATQLRPAILDELGLVEAIQWEIERFQDLTGIEYELSISPDEIDISREYSTAIYRVVQEAFTNVARHAQATKITVELKHSDSQLSLCITDNGLGIAEKQVLHPRSLGIIGMRERILGLGGNFEISGVEKKGTSIKATIPTRNMDPA